MEITSKDKRLLLEYLQKNANGTSIARGKSYYSRGSCKLVDINEKKGLFTFEVKGSGTYKTKIEGIGKDSIASSCSCPYNFDGICKHQVAVVLSIVNMKEAKVKKAKQERATEEVPYTYPAIDLISRITSRHSKLRHSDLWNYAANFKKLHNNGIDIQVEERQWGWSAMRFIVSIRREENKLKSICTCNKKVSGICKHEAFAWHYLNIESIFPDDFFLQLGNLEQIKEKAVETYGLKNIKQVDEEFTLAVNQNGVFMLPKDRSLQKRSAYMDWDDFRLNRIINRKDSDILRSGIVPQNDMDNQKDRLNAYVLKFNDADQVLPFFIHSIEGKPNKTKNKIVSKITELPAIPEADISTSCLEYLKWEEGYDEEDEGDYYDDLNGEVDLEADGSFLKTLAEIHPHTEKVFEALQDKICYELITSGEIRKSDLRELKIRTEKPELCFELNESGKQYIFKAFLKIGKNKKPLHQNDPNSNKFNYSILLHKGKREIYLYPNVEVALAVLNFSNTPEIRFHKEDFPDFFSNLILPISEKYPVDINVKEKPYELQMSEKTEKQIYLSELNDFILFKPIVDYGQKEVEIFQNGDTFFYDKKNKLKKLERNSEVENELMDFFLQSHPAFEKRKHRDLFYLSLDEMTENQWFFEFFKEAENAGIKVFGLDKLKKFRYNVNSPNVSVSVNSGIDWFDTKIEIKYGDQIADLSLLKKAIQNHQEYVQLGDGSIGLLPKEWIKKLERYFRAGQIKKDKLQLSKMHFSLLDGYFEKIDDTAVKREIEEKKAALKNFEKIEDIKLPKGLKAKLRDYQQSGYNWMGFLEKFSFGGCLADDMGLGKTLQVLTHFQEQKNRKMGTSLVVVPRSLIFNWQAEADKFCPKLKYYVHHGTGRNKKKPAFEKYDFVLTTYGTATGDIEILKAFEFNYIVLDESQAIKNPRSKRFKAMRLLTGRNRLALTGTPIENNTFDLYAQMQFLNPGFLGSENEFKKNYSEPIDKDNDAARAKELRQLIHPFILRRTKEQVATELPEKTENTIYCNMEPAQRKIYEALRNKYRDYVMGKIDEEGLNKSRIYVLEGLTKLRQVCNSPALISENGASFENVSIKLDTIKEHILSKTGKHKVLIFSQFVKMLKLIEQSLKADNINFAYLDGSTSNREEQVDRFQNNPECRAFLVSLKAGGTGLNLTAADYVYIVDPWWNPAVEAQAIDRCYRIGQDKHVFAYKLICKDTVEEKILELQKKKLKLSADLVKTEDAVFKKLQKDDIAALFG